MCIVSAAKFATQVFERLSTWALDIRPGPPPRLPRRILEPAAHLQILFRLHLSHYLSSHKPCRCNPPAFGLLISRMSNLLSSLPNGVDQGRIYLQVIKE